MHCICATLLFLQFSKTCDLQKNSTQNLCMVVFTSLNVFIIVSCLTEICTYYTMQNGKPLVMVFQALHQFLFQGYTLNKILYQRPCSKGPSDSVVVQNDYTLNK